MILPSKHVGTDRALLSIAAWLYSQLRRPTTISRLWDDLRKHWDERPLSYQWFVLAMDLLFVIGLIDIGSDGLIHRKQD